jgi:hypothetical protein
VRPSLFLNSAKRNVHQRRTNKKERALMMTVLAFSILVGLAYFVWNSHAEMNERSDDPLTDWPQWSRLK